MIRFIPDTWRDALLRPIAMAAPNSDVYVEIMAPDFRFVLILALALAWGVIGLRSKWRFSPTVLLFGFVALAFVPWLATSGNGRYFIGPLLVAGPLCVALIHRLPVTTSLRAAMAMAAVGLQIFVLYQSNPWQWWGLAAWKDSSFFEVDNDQKLLSRSSTYVTISSISYSLIAPRFPHSSRWINLTTQRGDQDKSPDGVRTQAFLSSASSLKIVFPSLAGEIKKGGLPGDALMVAINSLLAGHRLTVSEPADCRLLRSRGLASMASRQVSHPSADSVNETGFWICPLTRPAVANAPPRPVLPDKADKVFEQLERLCPRFFRPGEASTVPIPSGALRSYVASDTKVYVFKNGEVFYKYLKALNPVRIGTIDETLVEQFKMDCEHIHGRSGLPWERSI